jgi:hypothetical protein
LPLLRPAVQEELSYLLAADTFFAMGASQNGGVGQLVEKHLSIIDAAS